jgi:hypothetical protein
MALEWADNQGINVRLNTTLLSSSISIPDTRFSTSLFTTVLVAKEICLLKILSLLV